MHWNAGFGGSNVHALYMFIYLILTLIYMIVQLIVAICSIISTRKEDEIKTARLCAYSIPMLVIITFLQLLCYHMFYIILAIMATPIHSISFLTLYVAGSCLYVTCWAIIISACRSTFKKRCMSYADWFIIVISILIS